MLLLAITSWRFSIKAHVIKSWSQFTKLNTLCFPRGPPVRRSFRAGTILFPCGDNLNKNVQLCRQSQTSYISTIVNKDTPLNKEPPFFGPIWDQMTWKQTVLIRNPSFFGPIWDEGGSLLTIVLIHFTGHFSRRSSTEFSLSSATDAKQLPASSSALILFWALRAATFWWGSTGGGQEGLQHGVFLATFSIMTNYELNGDHIRRVVGCL